MKITFVFAAVAGLMASTALAQNQDLGDPVGEGGAAETVAIDGDGDGPLRGTVTDESAWQDIGVAIPSFATDRNQPTPANADGTEALGREVARVITANLRINGLFKPVGPDSLPQPSFSQITAPKATIGWWSGVTFTMWHCRMNSCAKDGSYGPPTGGVRRTNAPT